MAGIRTWEADAIEEPWQRVATFGPAAGIAIITSSARPSPSVSSVQPESPGCPFGTTSCGWSNSARR